MLINRAVAASSLRCSIVVATTITFLLVLCAISATTTTATVTSSTHTNAARAAAAASSTSTTTIDDDVATTSSSSDKSARIPVSKTMKDMGHTFLTSAADARRMRKELLQHRLSEKLAAEGHSAVDVDINAEVGQRAKVRVGVQDPDTDVTDMEWTDDRPHNESIFMPSECSYTNRSCCLYYQGSLCGGRGSCMNITEGNVCRESLGMFWFTDSYDMACVCEGNWWGAACEECAPGWMGEQCDQHRPLVVRNDFASLTDVDKQYVIDAFRLAKITPHPYQPAVSVYDYWALLHHWSLLLGVMEDRIVLDGLPVNIAEGHGGGAIPYHRSLVMGMERALQYVLHNNSFAMPFWNFTGSAGNDNDLTLQWFGGDGSRETIFSDTYCRLPPQVGQLASSCFCSVTRGPFSKWPLVGDWAYPLIQWSITRAFGCRTMDAPSTPSQVAAECAIRVDRYDLFHDVDVKPGHNDTEAPAEPYADEYVVDPNVMLRSPLHPSMAAAAQKLKSRVQSRKTASLSAAQERARVAAAAATQQALQRVRAELRAQAAATVEVDSEVEMKMETQYVSDDTTTSTIFFHALLGGGFLCGNDGTWPHGRDANDLHKRAHQWLAGSMIGNHPASDPIFWMLHSYADVIFEQWIRATSAKGHLDAAHAWSGWVGALGNRREDCQGPFYPLRTAFSVFKDSRDLGFTFALFNDHPSKPNLRPVYFDKEAWHWAYPHMDVLHIPDAIPVVEKDQYEIPRDTSFFVPSECGLGVGDSASSASCCPSYLGEECGGLSRGLCLNFTDSSDVVDLANFPDQLWWITNSFTASCQCLGNYAGVSCGECKPGFSGSDCTTPLPTLMRRDFGTLSTNDSQYVVDALRMARQAQSAYQPGVTVLAYFASMVYWYRPGNSYLRGHDEAPHIEYAHHGAVLWRRELLSRFERELQRITGNATFALPYWNWANSMNNDLEPVYRWLGGDGDTNQSIVDNLSPSACRMPSPNGQGGCNCTITRFPFVKPPTFGLFAEQNGWVQRAFACLGRVAASLPSPGVVEHCAQIETFYSTSNTSESFAKVLTGSIFEESLQTWPPGEFGDMMTRVENYVGGSWASPDLQASRSHRSSPGSDPMYYLALGYQDLILERWIRRAEANGWSMELPVTGAERGLNRGEAMAPFFPLKTNEEAFITSIDSGYTYDFFDSHPEDHLFI